MLLPHMGAFFLNMIKKILGLSSFWIVNKSIAKHLGCNDSALLLSDLIDRSVYFENKGEVKDGFFYYTSESIELNVNISYHKQKKCINILKKNGFIETKIISIPAKLHFKIIESKILNFLNTSIEKNEKQDVEIFETINNRDIIIDSNNKNNTICKSFKQFRFEEFESEVKQIASDNKIHPDHVSDFLDYWTEKDVTGKMGFQNQKTWETSKRLKRWVRSSKKQLPEYVWPGKSWDEMTFEERDKHKHIATPEQLKAHNSDNRNWF